MQTDPADRQHVNTFPYTPVHGLRETFTQFHHCFISRLQQKWLLVGLVISLNSSDKEALKRPLLCKDYSDPTCPTRNNKPNIHTAVSVVYDTFYNFMHVCSYC